MASAPSSSGTKTIRATCDNLNFKYFDRIALSLVYVHWKDKVYISIRTWAGCDAPNWGEICGTNLRNRFNIVRNSKEYSISTVAAQSKNYELVCEKLIRRSMHRCGGGRTVGWLVNDVANRCDFFKQCAGRLDLACIHQLSKNLYVITDRFK